MTCSHQVTYDTTVTSMQTDTNQTLHGVLNVTLIEVRMMGKFSRYQHIRLETRMKNQEKPGIKESIDNNTDMISSWVVVNTRIVSQLDIQYGPDSIYCLVRAWMGLLGDTSNALLTDSLILMGYSCNVLRSPQGSRIQKFLMRERLQSTLKKSLRKVYLFRVNTYLACSKKNAIAWHTYLIHIYYKSFHL